MGRLVEGNPITIQIHEFSRKKDVETIVRGAKSKNITYINVFPTQVHIVFCVYVVVSSSILFVGLA